jgi:hypothetical protein
MFEDLCIVAELFVDGLYFNGTKIRKGITQLSCHKRIVVSASEEKLLVYV